MTAQSAHTPAGQAKPPDSRPSGFPTGSRTPDHPRPPSRTKYSLTSDLALPDRLAPESRYRDRTEINQLRRSAGARRPTRRFNPLFCGRVAVIADWQSLGEQVTDLPIT
jgi:hypothetical protein